MEALSFNNETIEESGEITELLSKLFHHPCAPLWNHRAKDNLSARDLGDLRIFRQLLSENPCSCFKNISDSALCEWVEKRCYNSPYFYRRLRNSKIGSEEWFNVPTMSREDLVSNLEEIIPNDAPLQELRTYRTAGTTGHPVIVPHSKVSVACYQAFLEYALSLSGINCEFEPNRVACFLIGAQSRTVTYATTLSYWNNAGFAKLNLDKAQWKRSFDSAFYISEFNPLFLNGDPISFSKLLELDVDISPKALITTAVALSGGLRDRLEKRFNCPVIDWYSLTETGPIACKLPNSSGYKVIAPDLLVECLDQDGYPVSNNGIGEITVTGGRNPFLPLIRYRTGDFGRLIQSPNGEQFIVDLEGRKPVLFKRIDGSRLNSVDIAACLRPYPIVQYQFFQQKNLNCEITLRITSVKDIEWLAALKTNLSNLLGSSDLIDLKIDQNLGQRNYGAKIRPYRSELIFEE